MHVSARCCSSPIRIVGGVILHSLRSSAADVPCVPLQEGTIFVRVRFSGDLCPSKDTTNDFVEYLEEKVDAVMTKILEEYDDCNCSHHLTLKECTNPGPGIYRLLRVRSRRKPFPTEI